MAQDKLSGFCLDYNHTRNQQHLSGGVFYNSAISDPSLASRGPTGTAKGLRLERDDTLQSLGFNNNLGLVV